MGSCLSKYRPGQSQPGSNVAARQRNYASLPDERAENNRPEGAEINDNQQPRRSNELRELSDTIVKEIKDGFKKLKDDFKGHRDDLKDEAKTLKTLKDEVKTLKDDFKDNFKELKDDSKELKDEVRTLKDDSKVLKDDFKGDSKVLKDEFKVLKDDLKELKDDIKELKGDLKEFKDDFEEFNGEVNTLKALKDEVKTLKDIAEQRQLSIDYLTGSNLYSANTAGTTTRDDEYFLNKFLSLASAIRRWVFQWFKDIDVQNRDLPQEVRQLLEVVSLGYKPTVEEEIKQEEIEAAVIEQLYQEIFCSDFVFRISGFQNPISILGGTELEKRKWHAQTINQIRQNPRFDDELQENVRIVTEKLKDRFIDVANPSKVDKCYRSLQKVVKQAVQLELEICGQISKFELHRIELGAEHNTETMEDRSGSGGNGKKRVYLVHFPPVWRRDFDDQGNYLDEAVLVKKGVVYAR